MKSVLTLWCVVLALQFVWLTDARGGKRRYPMKPVTLRRRAACQEYRGTFCAKYLKGKKVYLTESQRAGESRIKYIYEILRRHVTSVCMQHTLPTLCYSMLPPCDPTSRKPKPRAICREDCHRLQHNYCKREFNYIKESDKLSRYVQNCSTLPGQRDPGYKQCLAITLSATVQNISMFEGKSVTLKCRLNTKKVKVHITWLKNGSPISSRFKIKNFRWGSRLRVRRVRPEDAGKYECVIVAKGTTIRAYGWLTIQKRDPITSDPPSFTGINNKYTLGPKPSSKPSYPRCEVYQGEVCKDFLDGEHVFAVEPNYIEGIEMIFKDTLIGIREARHMTKTCGRYAIRALCYHIFKTCDTKNIDIKPKLCREDCFALYDDVCASELHLAKTDPRIHKLLPNCSQLPNKKHKDHKFCTPLGIHKNGTNVEVVPFVFDNSYLTQLEQSKDQRCYHGTGKDYIGRHSMTQSGLPCQRWKLVHPVYNYSHNYCRNPRNHRDAPWCYVDENRYDFCDIPKCSGSDDVHAPFKYDRQHVTLLEKSKDQPCYNGTGKHYIGRHTITQSGLPCQRWKLVHPVYNYSHNYCRNPSNHRDAPWCYVDENRYDFCDIPKCSDLVSLLNRRTSAKSKPIMPVNRTIYVICSIMGVLVVAFVSIIVFLKIQHRRNALAHKDNSSSGSISKSTQSTVHQHSHDFKQSLMDVKSYCFSAMDDGNQGKVKFLEILGEGGFARVCKGILVNGDQEELDVQFAIKKLKSNVPDKIVENFRNETNVLASLQDINLLCLVGVSVVDPYFMVFEYYSDMDLNRYLRHREQSKLAETADPDAEPDEVLLLDFSLQVSSGLDYLEEKSFIHRDIACRNCYITEDMIVKISNLGIGSARYPSDYSWVHGSSLLPVRWMSPEALNTLHCTHQSDVWSFGVLLWEIYSYGRQPYTGSNNQEAIEKIRDLELLPCPDSCPARIYSLMKDCWQEKTWDRPNFIDISSQLRAWAGDSIGENH